MKSANVNMRDVIDRLVANIKFMKQLQRGTVLISILDAQALIEAAKQADLHASAFKGERV